MTVDEIRERAWRHALQAEALRAVKSNPQETFESAATSIALSLLLVEQQLDQIRLALTKPGSEG
jgi:hypothetical protein